MGILGRKKARVRQWVFSLSPLLQAAIGLQPLADSEVAGHRLTVQGLVLRVSQSRIIV